MFYAIRWRRNGTPHLAVGDLITIIDIARMLDGHRIWFKVALVGGPSMSFRDFGLTDYDYWLAPNATFPEETN
jgi:hypothetical protein